MDNVVHLNAFNNKETPMTVYENLAIDMSTETAIDRATADRVVNWLNIEGVLNTPVMNETYN